MTTEPLTVLELNCETNETSERPATPEEIAMWEADRLGEEARVAAEAEAAAAAVARRDEIIDNAPDWQTAMKTLADERLLS